MVTPTRARRLRNTTPAPTPNSIRVGYARISRDSQIAERLVQQRPGGPGAGGLHDDLAALRAGEGMKELLVLLEDDLHERGILGIGRSTLYRALADQHG